ncbi:MAG: preprotein translocase subunit SecG [Patescibacteria group bacterium]
MNTVLQTLHIITTLLLIGLILIQSKSLGLSPAFGGDREYHTKRGVEKSVFIMTIVFSVIFLLLSLVAIII